MLWALGWSKGEASQTLPHRLIEGDPEVGGRTHHGTGRQTSSKVQVGVFTGGTRRGQERMRTSVMLP